MNNPYIGPKPFETEDKDLFFGREIEKRDIISLIIAHPVTIIYSQSGAGKTSLLNTSILPGLMQEEFEILPVVRLNIGYTFRKFKNVDCVFSFNTLLNFEPDAAPVSFPHKFINDYLASKEKQLDSKGFQKPRVIVFDQFEELFTSYIEFWSTRERFIEDIALSLKNDEELRIVISIREDFIAQLDVYKKYFTNRLEVRYGVNRLNFENALKAVLSPLSVIKTSKKYGENVAEQLVDNLLKIKVYSENSEVIEVRGEYVEAVQLQIVCYSLWENLPDEDIITAEHLKKYGDPNEALSSFYNKLINSISANSLIREDSLRDFCEKKLITPIGTRSTVCRTEYYTEGLSNSIIDDLEKAHLIKSENRAGARWYELTHDRFIQPILSSNKTYLLNASNLDILEKIDQIRQKGSTYLQRKEYKEAIDCFEKILLLSKERNDVNGVASTSFTLGVIYFTIREYETALSCIDQSYELIKTHGYDFVEGEYLLKINILRELGRLDEALKICLNFINTNKYPSLELLHNIASIYWYKGDPGEAINYMNRIFYENESPDADDYSTRGQILIELSMFEEAESDLNMAIEMYEGSKTLRAYSLNGRGMARGKLKKIKESMSDFEESLRICPGNAWVYFNRAQIKEEMNLQADALEDFHESLRKDAPALPENKRIYALNRIEYLKSVIAD